MARWHRGITFALFFILAAGVLRGLSLTSIDVTNCDEFAHIHMTSDTNDLKSIAPVVLKKESSACHSGASGAFTAQISYFSTAFTPPAFAIVHDLVPYIENRAPNPNLEPPLRPPLAA